MSFTLSLNYLMTHIAIAARVGGMERGKERSAERRMPANRRPGKRQRAIGLLMPCLVSVRV